MLLNYWTQPSFISLDEVLQAAARYPFKWMCRGSLRAKTQPDMETEQQDERTHSLSCFAKSDLQAWLTCGS